MTALRASRSLRRSSIVVSIAKTMSASRLPSRPRGMSSRRCHRYSQIPPRRIRPATPTASGHWKCASRAGTERRRPCRFVVVGCPRAASDSLSLGVVPMLDRKRGDSDDDCRQDHDGREVPQPARVIGLAPRTLMKEEDDDRDDPHAYASASSVMTVSCTEFGTARVATCPSVPG